MVRLHVLDDKIVGPAAAERLCEVRHPGRPAAGIDRVHYGNLLIQDDIRIVRHPFRDDVLAFKQVKVEVVDPDVSHAFGNRFDHISTD